MEEGRINTGSKDNFRRCWLPLLQKSKVKAANSNNNNVSYESHCRRHSAMDSETEKLIAGDQLGLSDGRQRYMTEAVPRGFLAVYVGPEMRRFVIPASYLSMPDFMNLMERMVEYGYEQEGGLRIPCDEQDFEETLSKCLARHQIMSKARSWSLRLHL